MGAHNSRSNDSYTISFVGLDAYDKLKVFNVIKLRLGQVAKQVPRIASIVKEMSSEQTVSSAEQGLYEYASPVASPHQMIGDQDTVILLRSLFHRFFWYSDGVVYVVIGNNGKKLEMELKRFDKYVLRNDETRNMLLMILANEQEGPEEALSLEEVEDRTREEFSTYDPMLGGRTLLVRGCNSQTKLGLEEAFSHFAQIIKLRKGGQITSGFHNFTEDELCALEKKEEYFGSHYWKTV